LDIEITDPEAFRTVLEHVLTNAVEASPAGMAVSVRVEQRGGQARVSIEDHGAGMAQDFIARELFRPLRSTKGRGLGIGAYQAREIMRSLGGDIHVESEVGEGTVVTLLVPEAQRIRKVSGA
jgi:signal transduction histidine kinase